jgi:hypothetical protein
MGTKKRISCCAHYTQGNYTLTATLGSSLECLSWV